ncbi:penicillin-binding transpeptidase domain-containing protein [Alkaliphilus oremlandii]|uniref:Penicillin-binding protein transpeptidase n=1 Tax=Alkaliphilus oremlandii (strain OhILAs) TaxID=350688 RepID=A8MHM0_ALKOO|nr:penicillin-binding protein transpeptidase [Alkaliphilus oremlandii OhILAs]
MFLKKLNDRYNVIILGFAIIIIVIILRLANLMIVEGQDYREQSENRIFKNIPISAPRGEIRDRYGKLLAGNRPSFTVQIMRNEIDSNKINEVSLKLLNILEENGDKYTDEFPIVQTENGEYAFTYDINLDKWKETYGFIGIDGKEAFNSLKERYGIKEEDPYEAQIKLIEIPDITVPISIKESTRWRYTDELKKEDWLQSHGFKTEEFNIKAIDAFHKLRTKYDIPDSYSFEEARKIMVVREQIRSSSYLQYNPVKLAQDISPRAVAQIEENISDLPGISVNIESIRYYPEGELAAHLLGYLGKIAQQHEIDKYIKELKYLPGDIIGKTGLEHKFEEVLKGTDGYQKVLVDSKGRLMEVLEKQEAIPGETLYLSIDNDLQKKTEEVLKDVLHAIQTGGTYETRWGKNTFTGTSGIRKNAKSGAVVVLDIKTGKVLSLASYPTYDPNLFATGISGADWQSLMPENERDLLAPRPLLNIALSTAVQPGSTFKMLVGLVGLEQGLSPNYKILDKGYIKVGGHSFGNWLWNQRGSTMGYQNLSDAIRDSNNYYFYSLATGYDYGAGKPLPIKMSPEILIDYTKRFGLNDRTGIEIDIPREKSGGVPSIERKMDTVKAMLRNYLNRQLKIEDLNPAKIGQTEENVNEIINQILSWADENPSRGTLVNRMKEIGIREEKVDLYSDVIKYNYFNQAKWSIADTMNFSIGQGEHSYTPIQMANFMAILANDGYKYKVSVVDKTKSIEDGTVTNFPVELIERIELKNYAHLDEITKGMYEVTATGSTRMYFNKLPIPVAAKTGTAQKSGKIPPLDEVEYLKGNLSRYGVSLHAVEEKMQELKESNKNNTKYRDDAFVMREAIKKVNPNIKDRDIDQYKENYDNFTWFTGFAPYDDPQIAIAVLLPQGGTGGYGGPIFREIVAEYMGLNATNENENLTIESRLLP